MSSSDEQLFSIFTDTVKQKNPSIKTLLSIGGGDTNYERFSLMVSQSSYRKNFIDSSIKAARLYGFHGLDFAWHSQRRVSDMTNKGDDAREILTNTGVLFQEWRVAATSESRNSGGSQLILTMAAHHSPYLYSISSMIDSIERNLDWIHVLSYNYYMPSKENYTRAHAALYDQSSRLNTDSGIREWISAGIPASKLVLGLPFYGYAWTLSNPENNVLGAPAVGPANIAPYGILSYKDIANIARYGILSYKYIKVFMQRHGVSSVYNSTYVVNYCTFKTTWIGFDDVEAVMAKVSYAKEKKMLGYHVWQLSHDDNWVLSKAGLLYIMIHSVFVTD
ncbi:hypothetical protein F0562_030308 [Nyssa sinensis]|uniref:GH18 domain-containing protein n=1 Tax=Nyssa sinensis TaxID=561372 RepID=A0A5J5AW23_9ASTE|nr:hypothetical protein F0562_030308 [Nyssa sinensis]